MLDDRELGCAVGRGDGALSGEAGAGEEAQWRSVESPARETTPSQECCRQESAAPCAV